jgi:hypothetical protein
MDWGGDIELYADSEDFASCFIKSLHSSGVRILKQYRGESGRGIYKVSLDDAEGNNICVVHAVSGDEEQILSQDDFFREFNKYFDNGGMLINQPWVKGIVNGMVRCYITGNKVSGFGYQESVALCPQTNDTDSKVRPTSKRFYFSEECGLFQDLRKIMESNWMPQIQEIHSIADDAMPLLWDVDFFINDVNTTTTEEKYTLCEINVSCVSPYPPSCVNHIVEALKTRGERQ